MSRRSTLLMGLLAATWGGSYLLIKIALDDLPAPVIVCARVLLGGLVVLPLVLRQGSWGALRGRWRWVVLLAAVNQAGPFLLITFGEERIASGLAGVLVASSPVFAALLGLRFDRSASLGGAGWVGIALGMAGVVLLFGADLSGDGELVVGGLMVLLSGLGYAIGAHLSRAKLAGVPPLATATAVMLSSTALSLPWALLTLHDVHGPGLGPVAAVVGLGVLGTGLAFAIYFTLIAEVGASRASVVAYVAPGFSVVYGAVFLSEPITAGALGGLALILAGSWLAARDRGRGAAPRVSRSGPSRSTVPAPAPAPRTPAVASPRGTAG